MSGKLVVFETDTYRIQDHDAAVYYRAKKRILFFDDMFLQFIPWLKRNLLKFAEEAGRSDVAHNRHFLNWCSNTVDEIGKVIRSSAVPLAILYSSPKGLRHSSLSLTLYIVKSNKGRGMAFCKMAIAASKQISLGKGRSKAVVEAVYPYSGNVLAVFKKDGPEHMHVLSTMYSQFEKSSKRKHGKFPWGVSTSSIVVVTNTAGGQKDSPYVVSTLPFSARHCKELHEHTLWDFLNSEQQKALSKEIDRFSEFISTDLLSSSQQAFCDILDDVGIPTGVLDELLHKYSDESRTSLMFLEGAPVLLKGFGIGNIVAANWKLRMAVVAFDKFSDDPYEYEYYHNVKQRYLLVTPAGVIDLERFAKTALQHGLSAGSGEAINVVRDLMSYMDNMCNIAVLKGLGNRWLVDGDSAMKNAVASHVKYLEKTQHIVNAVLSICGMPALEWNSEIERWLKKHVMLNRMALLGTPRMQLSV